MRAKTSHFMTVEELFLDVMGLSKRLSVQSLRRKVGSFKAIIGGLLSVGAGKTVFLKLMGRALACRGCIVYMTSGNEMDELPDNYFNDLAKNAGSKTMVLLIDEVQNNLTSKHWLDLLKGGKPCNLVVLGVGVPRLQDPSPQFDKKYPLSGDEFPMFFTPDDLPELSAHFSKIALHHSENIIAEVCKSMLAFTAGHPFPFVKFMEHVVDPNNKIDLENIDNYTDSEEFSSSKTYQEVRERCFSSLLDGDAVHKGVNLMQNQANPGDEVDLEKLGLWRDNHFVSPLVVRELFLKHKPRPKDRDSGVVELKDPAEMPYAEQLISAGLRDMKAEDFMDAHYPKVAVENSVGFRWGFNVKACFPNVWMVPQPRTLYEEQTGPGRKPNIDFFFNGRINMGIELALDVNIASLDEHLGRFDDKYRRYEKSCAVFHLDTKNDSPEIGKWNEKRPVYTFLKKRMSCIATRIECSPTCRNAYRLLPPTGRTPQVQFAF